LTESNVRNYGETVWLERSPPIAPKTSEFAERFTNG